LKRRGTQSASVPESKRRASAECAERDRERRKEGKKEKKKKITEKLGEKQKEQNAGA